MLMIHDAQQLVDLLDLDMPPPKQGELDYVTAASLVSLAKRLVAVEEALRKEYSK